MSHTDISSHSLSPSRLRDVYKWLSLFHHPFPPKEDEGQESEKKAIDQLTVQLNQNADSQEGWLNEKPIPCDGDERREKETTATDDNH